MAETALFCKAICQRRVLLASWLTSLLPPPKIAISRMNPQYHYLDANQQTVGPHSVSELEKLQREGVITSQTLVAAEGGTEWTPFAKVLTGVGSQAAPPKLSAHDEFGYNDLLSRVNRTFDQSLMGFYKSYPKFEGSPVAALRRYLTDLNQLGLWGVVIAGALGFLIMMYLAIKSDETMFFIWGVAFLPATFVIQFLLSLMTSANLKLTFGEPLPLVSRLVPRTLTLVSTLILLAVFTYGGWGVFSVFKVSFLGGLGALATWLGTLVSSAYCGWLAARSEDVLGVEIRDQESQTAADYLFSVVRYFGRFFLACLPMMMALCSAAFIVMLVASIFRSMSGSSGMGEQFVVLRFFGLLDSVLPLAYGAVCLPIVGHIVFVLLVASSETGAAFFRLVENTRRIADAATSTEKKG